MMKSMKVVVGVFGIVQAVKVNMEGTGTSVPAMVAKEVYWIRHGQSRMNVNNAANVLTFAQRILFLQDADLTKKGEDDGDNIFNTLSSRVKDTVTDAGKAAKLLVDAVADKSAYVATSGLRRAVATVVRAFKGLLVDLYVDNNLTEASVNRDCQRKGLNKRTGFATLSENFENSMKTINPDLKILEDEQTKVMNAKTRGHVGALDFRVLDRSQLKAKDELKVRLHLVAALDKAFKSGSDVVVLNGHSLTNKQAFKAFGMPNNVGAESKMANGSVVKTKIVKEREHTEINITKLPKNFRRIQKNGAIEAEVMSCNGLMLTISISGNEYEINMDDMDFTVTQYKYQMTSCVEVVKGFEKNKSKWASNATKSQAAKKKRFRRVQPQQSNFTN